MTACQFLDLTFTEQNVALFDAKKISEKLEGLQKCELFLIEDFYVESRTSNDSKIKRTLSTFTSRNIPDGY